MHMSLHFNLKAMFFVKALSTNEDPMLFLLSAVLVFVYAAALAFLVARQAHKKSFLVLEPIFEFANMFVYMTYNFWIILILVVGKIRRPSGWILALCRET